MGNKEEPAYRSFEGKCRDCGRLVKYHNSVKLHPDHVVCEECRPRFKELMIKQGEQLKRGEELLAKGRELLKVGKKEALPL